jgi:hypothetical protein
VEEGARSYVGVERVTRAVEAQDEGAGLAGKGRRDDLVLLALGTAAGGGFVVHAGGDGSWKG